MKTELEWLRELEQQIQVISSDDRVIGDARSAVRQAKEAVNARIIEVLEANQLPCNEQGGGTVGLDTVDDFAMHCGFSDKHDGPHSFEEAAHQPKQQCSGRLGVMQCVLDEGHNGTCAFTHADLN